MISGRFFRLFRSDRMELEAKAMVLPDTKGGWPAPEYEDFKDWLFKAPVDLSKLDLTRDRSQMREAGFDDR